MSFGSQQHRTTFGLKNHVFSTNEVNSDESRNLYSLACYSVLWNQKLKCKMNLIFSDVFRESEPLSSTILKIGYIIIITSNKILNLGATPPMLHSCCQYNNQLITWGKINKYWIKEQLERFNFKETWNSTFLQTIDLFSLSTSEYSHVLILSTN
jgi:hypothetical protein